MNPAPSVIFFTSFSGLGFGFLAFLMLMMPDSVGARAFFPFFVAFFFAAGGMMLSVFHLANKKNAIKAFREWRTSWLSREAWFSMVTFAVTGLYAIGRIFFAQNWSVLGILGAALALVTVLTTSMIYTQIRAVPRWHTWMTPVMFLTYSLLGGAILAGQNWLGIVLSFVAAGVFFMYTKRGDTALAGSGLTMSAALGFSSEKKVRLFEKPHSGENYLLHEMGFRVGRKHSEKLRLIALISLGLFTPFLLFLPQSIFTTLIALIAYLIGVLVSRWLFFAEAEHSSSLYYGLG